MSRAIEAKCVEGVWHVNTAQSELSERSAPTEWQASGPVEAFVSNAALARSEDEAIWQFEWQKLLDARAERSLRVADEFARRCLRAPHRVHRVSVLEGELSTRAMRAALAAHGVRVSGLRGGRHWKRVRFGSAAILGIVAFAATALRSLFERQDDLPNTPIMIAVHGEVAMRTTHILRALAGDREPLAIIILGRPSAGLQIVRRLFAGQTGRDDLPMRRPFDFASMISSGRELRPRLAHGMALAADAALAPSFRNLVAAIYRVSLGSASAVWWRRQEFATKAVIYGHTGLADTTLLEREQQRSGVCTMHWVHGISVGSGFIAHSDIGLFQCAHDAAWHERLGGYARTCTLPAPPPECRIGGAGWLFLSNLIHPMNPEFQRAGPAQELRALREVADAAHACGVVPREVVWKPHPIFHTMRSDVRQPVLDHVTALGFAIWSVDRPFITIADFAVVIATPSTVAIDALKLGKLPIVLATGTVDEDSAIAQFPLRASAAVDLVEGVARMVADERALFLDTWRRIGPGMTPTLADVANLASSESRAKLGLAGTF